MEWSLGSVQQPLQLQGLQEELRQMSGCETAARGRHNQRRMKQRYENNKIGKQRPQIRSTEKIIQMGQGLPKGMISQISFLCFKTLEACGAYKLAGTLMVLASTWRLALSFFSFLEFFLFCIYVVVFPPPFTIV